MSLTLPTEIANATRRSQTYAGVPDDVLRGIQNASAKTGVDFKYLVAQAQIESGFDADAKASTSSARGLYQFIDQTWLKMVKDHGADHGLGNLADAITQGADGRMKVSDAATRKQILALRDDPALSAVMGAEFANDNKAYLAGRLDRDVNSTDLYMAHFLGAGGASKFLSTMDKAPATSAASVMPDAAAANRSIFYAKDGRALSVREVYARFADKIENAGASAGAAVTAQGKATLGAIAAIGGRIGDGFAAAAAPVARMFLPALSGDAVVALASLPVPGEKTGQDGVTAAKSGS
ncbi:transglycosylase SLT domain-containing protein [Zavarzinia aquatilis]|uniref:transglycosylase SLT domain-containing protein n=1 Tax=Zavarzinia aquatilis TaxID=2211142 RepID=UPI001A9C9FAC|nr:transglycosylase SLT domain-containing protein [Zavarzinia aquatilis]